MPVIGRIRIKEALRFGGRIMGASVQRRANRWFLCVQVDVDVSWPVKAQRRQATGVGLNINGVVCSNGKTYATPQPLKKAARRLKMDQRSVSRKVEAARRCPGPALTSAGDGDNRPRKSNNHIKAAAKLARRHYRVGCIRHDFLHKTTTELTRENQALGIEGLHVKGMTASAAGTMEAPGKKVRQKTGLKRAILDVGFGEFMRQIA